MECGWYLSNEELYSATSSLSTLLPTNKLINPTKQLFFKYPLFYYLLRSDIMLNKSVANLTYLDMVKVSISKYSD